MKTRNAEAVRLLGKTKPLSRALKILGDFGEIEISFHFLYKKIEENPPGKNRRKKRENIPKEENQILSKISKITNNIGAFRSQNPSKRSVKKVQKRSEMDFFLTWILLRKAPMLVD